MLRSWLGWRYGVARDLFTFPAGHRWISSSQRVAATAKKSRTKTTKSTVGAKGRGAARLSDGPAPLLPASLALQELRTLAVLCGRNSAGTKQVLRADLDAAVLAAGEWEKTVVSCTTPLRILSIDMGVRNLAYCLLEVTGTRGTAAEAVPRLVAWERLSLIGGDDKAHTEDMSSSKPAASLFAPPAMAIAAARLVCDRLLPLAPTHVLIERQRFRSGGGAAVLEWTVRVNSLEAMLHGILAFHNLAYRHGDDGVDGAGTVPAAQAVSPQRVSQFLLRGGMGEGAADADTPRVAKTAAATRVKAKDIKDAKEAFVAALLRTAQDGSQTVPRPLLRYDPAVHNMVDAFLVRWKAKEARSRLRERTKTTQAATSNAARGLDNGWPRLTLSKIDDLADCVAQGLIWLAWERNKAILRHNGAEALLAQNRLKG